MQATAWLMTALAVGLTIGRCFIHWRKKNRRLRWDDIFNVAAAILLIIHTTIYQLYIPPDYNSQLHAMGIKEGLFVGQDPIIHAKFTVADILLFWLLMYAVKASFLALYWELFNISMRFRIAWIATAVFTTMSFAVTWVSIFWRCGSPKDVINLSKY